MGDLVFILLTFGFFGPAYAYIGGCARILGRDPTPSDPAQEAPAERAEAPQEAAR